MKIDNITKNIMDLNLTKIFNIIPSVSIQDYTIIHHNFLQEKIAEIVCYEQLENSTRINIFTIILYCKISKIFHKKIYILDTQTGDIPKEMFNKSVLFCDISINLLTAPYIYTLDQSLNQNSIVHFYGNTRVKFSNKKHIIRYLHSLISKDTYNMFFAKILLEHPELTDINMFFNSDI